MSAEFSELVRAMELACYRLNPPHRPISARFSLSDLGAEVLKEHVNRPEWQSAYLRGIAEIARNKPIPPLTPKTIEVDLGNGLSAVTTLTDGRIVGGSGNSKLQIWFRIGVKWQCEALSNNTSEVRALAALPDGRFVSAVASGSLNVWREVSGGWEKDEIGSR